MKFKLLLYYLIVIFATHYKLEAQSDTSINHVSKESIFSMIKDTLDGKLDFSRFLIDAKGFIPIPYILTEPALGGFGIAIIPTFITPKKRPEGYNGYTPPDITAGFGMYTANNSWIVGGIRIGSFPSQGLKYRIGGGYADINISFYRDVANKGEKEFAFSIKATPIILSLSKRILKQDVYLGLQYFFSSNKLSALFKDSLPETIKSNTLNSNIGSLGTFIDWDKRDNFFTPDKGYRANVLLTINDNWTASDFNYQKLSGFLNWFVPFNKTWISGFRTEVNFMSGDPPFYALPSLSLRGVPAVRYQGTTTALFETEQRIDFGVRWSAVAFTGVGSAWGRDQNSDTQVAYNFGGGFRYLIARTFKIRAGIDLAKGPDSWGWYIVFGHNWNR
jgi:hypothetical protein